MDEKPPQKDPFKNAGALIARLADLWNVLAAMGVCPWLGFVAGGKMGDAQTGALVGAFVGLMYVAYLIWQALKKGNKK